MNQVTTGNTAVSCNNSCAISKNRCYRTQSALCPQRTLASATCIDISSFVVAVKRTAAALSGVFCARKPAVLRWSQESAHSTVPCQELRQPPRQSEAALCLCKSNAVSACVRRAVRSERTTLCEQFVGDKNPQKRNVRRKNAFRISFCSSPLCFHHVTSTVGILSSTRHTASCRPPAQQRLLVSWRGDQNCT